MKEAEKILERTNGGLEVFEYFFGENATKKLFLNPFRGDTSPSCHLYLHREQGGDRYYLKDFGSSEWSGDCFSVAGKILNLNPKTSFVEILHKIDSELNLQVFSDTENATPLKQWKATKTTPSCKNTVISFRPTFKDFTEKEKEYWQQYGITREILNKYNVRSIHNCIFNKQDGNSFRIYGSKEKPAFSYLFNEGLGIKVYMPKSPVRFLYAGKLPKPYLFGWEQLPQRGEQVFITGGEKDVLSLASHGFHAISLNSETAHVSEEVLDELSSRFKRIIFLYDSDETGKKESELRVQEHKEKYPVERIILPLTGTKSDKDISDYFRNGNQGETFKKLFC